MTQVIEYIMQNYTWFLFGAIIILLAIIGYYADKTNFGQGKNSETDDKNKINIDKLGLMDITSDIANKEQNLTLQNTDNQALNLSNNQSNNNSQDSQLLTSDYNKNVENNDLSDASIIANMQLPEIDTVQTNVSQESLNTNKQDETQNELIVSNENGSNSTIVEELNKQFNTNNSDMFNSEIRDKIDQETKKREEEFNRFNDEFNSLLPKKDLINGDLLSEINDLQLDKTQKLDLSDLTKFEKIELPRISNSIEEEQDIWKF